MVRHLSLNLCYMLQKCLTPMLHYGSVVVELEDSVAGRVDEAVRAEGDYLPPVAAEAVIFEPDA